MHELAVCQALIAELDAHAEAHEPARIASVTVQIGPLSGVVPDLLKRAYELAREGTVAAEAALIVEDMSVRVYCSICDLETVAMPNNLVCGRCGNWCTRLRSGDELVLRAIEFVGEDGLH